MSLKRTRAASCPALRTLTRPRALRAWAADGVRLADGRPLPPTALRASLVLTADTRSFLVYRNYESILAYNCSHYYALSVGLLADRFS
jgi:membrane-bound lytic murein transglycosylase B